MVVVSNFGQPGSETQIVAFERMVGGSLPADYRAFLLDSNGGRVSPKRFATEDGKVESMVSILFPLSGGLNDEDLLREFQGFNLAKQLPLNLISIGKDPADNRIVMSIRGKDLGVVYYWSWDEEPEPVTCSYSYMRVVSWSFSDFLNRLY